MQLCWNIKILVYRGKDDNYPNSICTFLFCKNTDIILLSLRYYILIFPYYLLRARDWCEIIRSKQVFERLFYVTYTLFAWLVLQKLNGQRQTLDYIFRTIKHPSFVLFGLSISYSEILHKLVGIEIHKCKCHIFKKGCYFCHFVYKMNILL